MMRFLLVLMVYQLQTPLCFATLGQPASSIDTDQLVFSGVRQNQVTTEGNSAYLVEQIKIYQGVTLREYVGSNELVFGVAWSGGRRHPDLKQLLGSYYGEFRLAARNSARKAGNRNHGVTSSNGVVVETLGHMGNLQGRAYLPALLPKGVSPSEIK